MSFLLHVVFAACAVVAIVVAVLSRSSMQAAFAALVAELARRGIRYRGLSVEGTALPASEVALDFPLNGILLERSDGVRASITRNRSHGAATLPGFTALEPQLTLVEVPVALPDQMICAPDRAQAAFGPFPPDVTRTANPQFDQRFGIYVRAEEGQGYRPAPPDPAPWARSPAGATIFTNFDTLGFVAMHVHGGRARMLFAPVAIDGLVAAMDTAALVARPHEARQPARRPSLARSSNGAVLLGALGFVPMAIGLPMLPSATEAGLEIAGYGVACPKGGTFKARFRNSPASCQLANGTSYRVDESVYTAWRTALCAFYGLAVVAAATALYFKLRRDTARGVVRNLAG